MEPVEAKVIISDTNVKRILPNNFDICGSPDTIETLGRKLIQTAAAMRADNNSYGWMHVQIYFTFPSSGLPKRWDE